MMILAIETTAASASVALADGDGDIYQETSVERLSHLQNLIPMVDRLLDSRRLKIGDLTHIAVSQGPGSFTGIRIGMATGKALAQALDLPAVSVATLKSFCWNLPDFNGLVCPILDARRKQIYGGAYFKDGYLCKQLVRDDAWQITDYLQEIDRLATDHSKELMFFGDGVKVYEDLIKQWAISTKRLSSKDNVSRIIASSDKRYQRADSVAFEAIKMIEEGKVGRFNSLVPVYLRKAEAERKLEQSRKSEKVASGT